MARIDRDQKHLASNSTKLVLLTVLTCVFGLSTKCFEVRVFHYQFHLSSSYRIGCKAHIISSGLTEHANQLLCVLYAFSRLLVCQLDLR